MQLVFIDALSAQCLNSRQQNVLSRTNYSFLQNVHLMLSVPFVSSCNYSLLGSEEACDLLCLRILLHRLGSAGPCSGPGCPHALEGRASLYEVRDPHVGPALIPQQDCLDVRE